MNRRELIRAVAAHTAQDPKQVESVVSGITDVITAVVSKGEPVTIQGFAKVAKVERAARMGRNPRTGEQIRIKASKRVRVSPMKAFKDTVMAPAQAPRLSRGVWPTSPELLSQQASERKSTPTTNGRRVSTRTAAAAPTAKKAPVKKATGVKKVAKKAPVKKATAKVTAKRTTVKKAAKKTAARRTTAR